MSRRVERAVLLTAFLPLFVMYWMTTRMHIRMLERFIRVEPAYWPWSRRRWKYKRVVEE